MTTLGLKLGLSDSEAFIFFTKFYPAYNPVLGKEVEIVNCVSN